MTSRTKKTSVGWDPPSASAPEEPRVRLEFPTAPGFSSRATISQQTARELLEGLQRIVGVLPQDAPNQNGRKPQVTISTDLTGVLWRRDVQEANTVVVAKEDAALFSFLADSGTDVQITIQ